MIQAEQQAGRDMPAHYFRRRLLTNVVDEPRSPWLAISTGGNAAGDLGADAMDTTQLTDDEIAVLAYYGTWAPVGHAVEHGTGYQLIKKGLVEHANTAWPYRAITDAGIQVLRDRGIQAPLPMPTSQAEPDSYALYGGSGSCAVCGGALNRDSDSWAHYNNGGPTCDPERVTPKPHEKPPAVPAMGIMDVTVAILAENRKTTGNCHYCGLPVGPRGCEECV